MARSITVGLDGSPESRAAAEWAEREASPGSLPLKLLHVFEPVSGAQKRLLGSESDEGWTERIPRGSADGLRLRHPGVEVITDRVTGGVGGFVMGSVGLAVIAHAARPVVLVRAGEQAADEHKRDPVGVPSAATAVRPVVGLDTDQPDETLLGFAFDAAVRRDVSLRVVHAWPTPPTSFYRFSGDAELQDSLQRRQATVLTEVRRGAAEVLVNASRDASPAVVGRRIRTSPLGVRIGHVTHAALHHVAAPVAVVAHD